MAEVTTVNVPVGDFVTTTLNGAISSGSTSFTIGTGLTLDANGGFLQINYDSVLALGVSDGPETVSYTGYVTGTGAVTGVTRAQAGTTAVAHSNGATVQCGTSAKYLMNGTVLGYATTASNQGTFTAETDLTSLAVTVTVPAGGRRIKITGYTLLSTSVADDTVELRIKEGATQLVGASKCLRTTVGETIQAVYIVAASAGSHTYKLAAARSSGSGNITKAASATYPDFILVELI